MPKFNSVPAKSKTAAVIRDVQIIEALMDYTEGNSKYKVQREIADEFRVRPNYVSMIKSGLGDGTTMDEFRELFEVTRDVVVSNYHQLDRRNELAELLFASHITPEMLRKYKTGDKWTKEEKSDLRLGGSEYRKMKESIAGRAKFQVQIGDTIIEHDTLIEKQMRQEWLHDLGLLCKKCRKVIEDKYSQSQGDVIDVESEDVKE